MNPELTQLVERLDNASALANNHEILREAAQAICRLSGEVEKLEEELRSGSPTERAPTQWAYDQACKALHRRHDQLSDALALLELVYARQMSAGGRYPDDHWTSQIRAFIDSTKTHTEPEKVDG